MIDCVEFKQWTTTDRATLETNADEFLRVFLGSLPGNLRHDFIVKQQSQYLQRTRSMLRLHEFLVIGDFTENYSFVLQDPSQLFHWNNLQATFHPFVYYYIDNTTENDTDAPKNINHVSRAGESI